MSNWAIGRTVLIYKDDFAYISHPSIAVLGTGEWIAAFNHSRRREPRMHPPSDPLFRTLLARSPDQGKTWEKPYFAPTLTGTAQSAQGSRNCGMGPSCCASSGLGGIR